MRSDGHAAYSQSWTDAQVNPSFASLAARCALGLGRLERRGSRGRPWLTLIRPSSELSYLHHLHWKLRSLHGEGTKSRLDWLPGIGGGDVARLRFHGEQLADLVDMPADVLWATCSTGCREALGNLLSALWLDRGTWRSAGRGALVWARTGDDIKRPLHLLRLHGIVGARTTTGGGGRIGYQPILIPEASMPSLTKLLRPWCHGTMVRHLRRPTGADRHGLMGLMDETGPAPIALLREAMGFLP